MTRLIALIAIVLTLVLFRCGLLPEPSPSPSPDLLPICETTPEPEPPLLIIELTPSSTPNPAPEPVSVAYILNTNTKKFHYPDCPSVDDMKEKNKKEFSGSRDELIARGYEPCKRCNP